MLFVPANRFLSFHTPLKIVTVFAKCLNIFDVKISPALGPRADVVRHCCPGNMPPGHAASAERMRLNVGVAESFPFSRTVEGVRRISQIVFYVCNALVLSAES